MSNSDDINDEDSPSNSTDSSTSDNGILERRRTAFLLQILRRHIINRRIYSSSREHQDLPSSPPPAAGGTLRVLSNGDAIANEAICRFCLEGPSSSQEPSSTTTGTNGNPGGIIDHNSYFKNEDQLVAPCNCSGGSEWVHTRCLRRWQRQVSFSLRDQHKTSAARCNVCTAEYLLPPLSPPRLNHQLFKPGTLLIEAGESGGTFRRTVVMLLNDLGSNGTTCGLIINSPLIGRTGIPSSFQDAVPDYLEVTWKRGGPVCGGRLGVVRYIVGHTLDLQEGAQLNSQYQSHRLFGSSQNERATALVNFLYEASNHRLPATIQGEDLQDIVREIGQTCTASGRLILFSGYCKWMRGQLEREVQRGFWSVCQGRVEDVLKENVDGMWEELRQGGRLFTPQELVVEEFG